MAKDTKPNPKAPKNPVKFTAERQPTREARLKGAQLRVEKTRKRRELAELLNMTLGGNLGKNINTVLEAELGTKAETLEEALHYVMISKAMGKDVSAYNALMNVSGIAKPIKTDITSNGQTLAPIDAPPDLSLLTDEELTQLLAINRKLAND